MEVAPLKTVIVTGGSRGIGAATAWLCAQRGWAVAVNYSHSSAAAPQNLQKLPLIPFLIRPMQRRTMGR